MKQPWPLSAIAVHPHGSCVASGCRAREVPLWLPTSSPPAAHKKNSSPITSLPSRIQRFVRSVVFMTRAARITSGQPNNFGTGRDKERTEEKQRRCFANNRSASPELAYICSLFLFLFSVPDELNIVGSSPSIRHAVHRPWLKIPYGDTVPRMGD